MSLAHLKSGTDIRGTAMGPGNELTDEVVRAIIVGFVAVLKKKTGVPVEKIIPPPCSRTN